MEIRGIVAGQHPLSEDLTLTILDWKYGRKPLSQVTQGLLDDVSSFVKLQHELGLSMTSAQMGIQDILRPFVTHYGCYSKTGGVSRWHTTNTFYRRYTLNEGLYNGARETATSNARHPLAPDENAFLHYHTHGCAGRIVLPGPYTWSKMTDVKPKTYMDEGDYICDIGRMLANEIGYLPERYMEIQIDDPWLVWEHVPLNMWDSIITAYRFIWENTGPRRNIILNTYFGDAAPVMDLFQSLKIDGVGIDFTNTNIMDLMDVEMGHWIIQAGLFNSRNFYEEFTFERAAFLLDMLRIIASKDPMEILVATNTSLDYLPRDLADKYLMRVAALVANFKLQEAL